MSKNKVVFLPVPQIPMGADSFEIDPDIPIPVELPHDDETFTIENLTMQMILKGMLRVIEEGNIAPNWVDYYSRFILAVRPDLIKTLNEIIDSKASQKKADRENKFEEFYEKAKQFIRQEKINEGLENIYQYIKNRPLEYKGWFILGWALRLDKRWQDAAAAFKKTIELGGGISETHNEYALCLIETGDYENAFKELDEALKKSPNDIKIISNMAVLSAKTGDKDKAAKLFKKVLEIDSSDPIAIKYLEESS